LLGALCIGLVYFVLRSPWLSVTEINTPDLPGISGEDISDALKIQMLGNHVRAMLGPRNILFWKWGSYPDSLWRFPALKNLGVQTDFWKRSVNITAEERKLWGVVCDAAGSICYGLDENGIIFSQVPDVSGSLLLKIGYASNRVFLLGQPLFSRPEWFSNFRGTIDALNRNGFRVVAIKSVDLSSREWTAQLAQGPDFYFSLNFMPENLDSILKGLGSKLDFNKTSYIDFRVPNRIYYK